MNQLVLSLFPGIGMLDRGFEETGFCVVRGPDILWAGDIHRFHPPAGKFDGVIGGPPCQMFSRLAHMVRHNGYEPRFGNLIPEFERCVAEAAPQWFLMENVPDAPVPAVARYVVHSFLLNNRQLGEAQNRVRRWSFGWQGGRRILQIATVPLEPMEFEYTATGGSARPEAIGGSGKPKKYRGGKGAMPWNGHGRADFEEVRRKQGLPDDFDLAPFTVRAKCEAIGNGVPMAMGRALAKAVRKAVQPHDAIVVEAYKAAGVPLV